MSQRLNSQSYKLLLSPLKDVVQFLPELLLGEEAARTKEELHAQTRSTGSW